MAAAALVASPGRVHAADLFVAVSGADDTVCGPEGQAPCRSISRAIAHATDGDRIIVGPGLYGDIDRNGIVDASGDSGEETTVVTDMGPTIVAVGKRLTVVSTNGAISTVIDAGHASNNLVVGITADGTVFGKSGKGFTLRQAMYGVGVDPSVTDAKVSGNIAERCTYGFHVGSNLVIVASQGTELRGNAASSCDYGFVVMDRTAVVRDNVAVGNSTGFNVQGGAGTLVTKNLASGNTGVGFVLTMTPPYTELATPTFTGNASTGNGGPGVLVGFFDTAEPATAQFAGNTMVGNSQAETRNCGLLVTNNAMSAVAVDANGNWWGAESGPGPDPADSAGGVCNLGFSVTTNVTDWLSKAVKVAPKIK